MSSSDVLERLRVWVKFPHMYKHKIHEAVVNGFLLKLLNEPTLLKTDAAFHQQLQDLVTEHLKKVQTTNLVKLYKTLNKTSAKVAKAHSSKIEQHFVRVNPRKRTYLVGNQ